jgi:Ala-tRNA(Pro) deacylase
VENSIEVYQVLDKLKITYQKRNHPPVFTLEEFKEVVNDLEGGHCKNLFLRNKKGHHHYLVVCLGEKKIDLKMLTKKLNEDRLSFASPERMNRYLGLKKGAVSPFGLINDVHQEVVVVLDKELKRWEKLNFHPLINTETLAIKYLDLLKFINHFGNKIIEIDL